MKLSKGIFLNEVNEWEEEISITLSVQANNEWNALFFDFSKSLDCDEFKRVCKILNITQKAFRQLINERL